MFHFRLKVKLGKTSYGNVTEKQTWISNCNSSKIVVAITNEGFSSFWVKAISGSSHDV